MKPIALDPHKQAAQLTKLTNDLNSIIFRVTTLEQENRKLAATISRLNNAVQHGSANK